ncbi:MAG: YkgJ family cysteine cluster protein [Phascolarctobacterium sp.]|nr:YkgJ family cysteine cluster protein [Phascolarctobacterium sp.]
MFKCDCCGLCCRHVNLNSMYTSFDRGDGVCKFLDLESNLCTIYKERPLLCNVDAMYEFMYQDEMTREEFYELNYEVCRKLKNGTYE